MKTDDKRFKERYPFHSSFTTEEANLFLFWKSPDGDARNAKGQNVDLVVRPDAELYYTVKDEAIVRKLLSWSPQKVFPVVLDLISEFAFLHWLEWLSNVVWWNWAREYPALEKEIEAVETAINTLKDAYYIWANAEYEKRQSEKKQP